MSQNPTEKKCGRCGIVKDAAAFGGNRAKSDGLQSHCRECKRAFQQAWYARNKQQHIANVHRNRKARTRAIRTQTQRYLAENPCVDYGESEPLMLDFDHVRGQKRGEISQMVSDGLSWEAIQAEIAKCEVRCVRCHRRKTAAQLGWFYLTA